LNTYERKYLTLLEALEIINRKKEETQREFPVFYAAGYTPLHLLSFTQAYLQTSIPHERVIIKSGLFNDLIGNISMSKREEYRHLLIHIEWPDLDPRLGLRSSSGWDLSMLTDVIETIEKKTHALIAEVESAAASVPITLCFPTLPIFPMSYQPPYLLQSLRTKMDGLMHRVQQRFIDSSRVQMIDPYWLDLHYTGYDRYDAESEISFGFPFTLPFASFLGALFADTIRVPAPKKGLITDLDGTLWSGILGDVGEEGIQWSLDHHAMHHGLYQRLLLSLSETGALIAVASKNDMFNVEKAFQRQDLIFTKDKAFPIQAHWNPKSLSVREILRTWNIGEDSVVFIDDSPLELEEVKRHFPKLTCLRFPKEEPKQILPFLHTLRQLFGKRQVTEEDKYRVESIRTSSEVFQVDGPEATVDQEALLSSIQSKIEIYTKGLKTDTRAFELVNKTNQFNLNGERYSQSAWDEMCESPNFVGVALGYKDKFGPLGKILVLLGEVEDGALDVRSLVMSCRAFSRRVEHRCLQWLFENYELREMRFHFRPTEKNGPIQSFFKEYEMNTEDPLLVLKRDDFYEKVPELYHAVEVKD